MNPRFPSRMAVCSILVCLAVPTAGAAGSARIPGVEGKSVLLVRRPDPGFELVTSSGSLVGAFAFFAPGHATDGQTAIQEAGRRIASEDQIDDPAVALGDALLADLASAYALRVSVDGATTVEDSKQLEALRKRSGVGLILEFYTEAWRTFYFLDFKHYDVWYYAKVRLIDGQTGAVLRSGKCAHKPEKTPDSPTIDGLLADHGAKLRAAVEAAKRLCLAGVRQEFGI